MPTVAVDKSVLLNENISLSPADIVQIHAAGPIIGAQPLSGPIAARWNELGGASGFLGNPTTGILSGADLDSAGQFAHFTGGSLYYKPLFTHSAVTGITSSLEATELHAADMHVAAEHPAGLASVAAINLHPEATLDAPLAATVSKPVVPSSTGCFEIHGAIRDKYLSLGAEASVLGYPRSDETGTPDGVGRFNRFEDGSIYWTPVMTAHEVYGPVAATWTAAGAEKNPQLEYPLSDERIPDVRIGHVRPETRKAPTVPPKSATGVNVHLDTAALSAIPALKPGTIHPQANILSAASAQPAALEAHSISGHAAEAIGSQPAQTVPPGLLTGVFLHLDLSSSSPGPTPSKDRFADFANGVVFWHQASGTTSILPPTPKTADGASLAMSGPDVAAAVLTKIGVSVFQTKNVAVAAATYAGVTDYSFDGLQTHNRRHRIQLHLTGQEAKSIGLFGSTMQPADALLELTVEVAFDDQKRRVTLTPVVWGIVHASTLQYQTTVSNALHATLDPVLWFTYDLLTLPDTNDGDPYAVLSVKTLPTGDVGVYLAPQPTTFFRPGAVIEEHLPSLSIHPTA